MSGFRSSVETQHWDPKGTPAIYRMINALDTADVDLNIIWTLKNNETIDNKFLQHPIDINNLSVKPIILAGSASFPRYFSKISTYLSELRQMFQVYRIIKKTKPSILYIDRANVLIGAVIARFTKIPVHLRLLGTPPSLETLLSTAALSHSLYRWAYRSPFKMVLCSRDGSPSEQWMNRALKPKTARKHWVNGVDDVDVVREPSTLIRVVLIGRLNPLKQIDKAVEAILSLPESQLKKIHVDIIGDGELLSLIQEKIIASGDSLQFTLHGAIPHEKVLKQLSQNDILISINTHGNLTNTVLEAIRCGLCLMLPQADKKTGIDQDTYTVIPKNAVIQLSQDDLLGDLKDQLSRLINQPELIQQYQEKTSEISKNIDTWDARIQKEVQLLKSYDFVIVISDLRGGGTQKVLERLLNQWVKQKKRIAMVTLDLPENDMIQLPEMVDRISLGGVSESSNVVVGLFKNMTRIFSVRRMLKRLNAPLVISFLSAMNIVTVLATRGLKSRLIISERNDPARQSFGRFWDYLRRKLYRHADIVTANSYSAIDSLTKFVEREKCHYVPNPLVVPDAVEPIKLDKKAILAVGRLHEQKAYDVLIHAFALFHRHHPEWQLIILGEGPLRQPLEKQIEKLQLADSIHLKGYANPFPYYAAADIYTMPSRYEGMPNALLEALAMGVPSVISDALMGPLNFISDRNNAMIVPVENAAALAAAFSDLSDNDALRSALSNSAKQAIRPFMIDEVMPKWEVLLNE